MCTLPSSSSFFRQSHRCHACLELFLNLVSTTCKVWNLSMSVWCSSSSFCLSFVSWWQKECWTVEKTKFNHSTILNCLIRELHNNSASVTKFIVSVAQVSLSVKRVSCDAWSETLLQHSCYSCKVPIHCDPGETILCVVYLLQLSGTGRDLTAFHPSSTLLYPVQGHCSQSQLTEGQDRWEGCRNSFWDVTKVHISLLKVTSSMQRLDF